MIRLGICFWGMCFLLLSSLPVSADKLSLPITVDGFAKPIRGDSANVTVVAQVDSILGVWVGPLIFTVRARDQNGHTLFSKEQVNPVRADTTLPRQIAWSFRSGPGKVKVQVRAKALDLKASGDADFDLDVPRFSKEAVRVSMPQIGRRTPVGRFQPVPNHRFQTGADRVAVLLLLGSQGSNPIAETDTNASLQVRWLLRRQSKVVKDSTFTHNGTDGDLMIEESPNRWGSGTYSFQITLTSPRGSVQRTGGFQVAAGGADLLRDPILARTVLGYIASGAERQDIETASVDSLPSVWARFWKRRDTTPGTSANEAMERFVDRVGEATNKFGGVVPGWRSDRGRILIQHGDPDRTERVFDPTTRIETEIWYYDQRNLSYVFQDPEGFGNYKLTGGQ